MRYNKVTSYSQNTKLNKIYDTCQMSSIEITPIRTRFTKHVNFTINAKKLKDYYIINYE